MHAYESLRHRSCLAALLLACGLAQAVELTPGSSATFMNVLNGMLQIPGTNLAADPSLAGDVLAQADRAFTIVVTTEYRWGMPRTQFTIEGTVRDWVVRRDDTGTLDFYSSLHLPARSFAGTLTRPWSLGAASAVTAQFRDDLVPDGSAPTRLSLFADGGSVAALYYASDYGVPNWVTDAAPVLFRSSLTQFALGEGRLEYGYGTEFSASSGSVALSLYMPVPEVPSVLLTAAGLLGLGVVRRRSTHNVHRTSRSVVEH